MNMPDKKKPTPEDWLFFKYEIQIQLPITSQDAC